MTEHNRGKCQQDYPLELAQTIHALIEVSVFGPSGIETPPCAEAWSTARLIAELSYRVEALEIRAEEDKEAWAAMRRAGSRASEKIAALEDAIKSAESNYPEKPDSSLVERVLLEIENGTACDRESARIAHEVILSIAAWVDRLGYHSCAAELRKEVPQSL